MPSWEDIKNRNSDTDPPESKPIETSFYRVEGIRNSISKLELRLKSGSLAIDYSMIPVIFSPADDIIIIPTMSNIKITISASNMRELKMYLTDNRVKWLTHHFGTKIPQSGNDLFVDDINIEYVLFEDVIAELSGKMG